MNPLVSVIVPLYNYERYISWCIKSVLRQDYDNFELIVIDDCSTDNSYQTAKSFESEKVRVLQMPQNSGYSKAKNEGIISSKGEFIATLDADDMFTKNSISSRISAVLSNSAEFVHGTAINIGTETSLKEAYAIKHIERQKAIIHAQTVLMARNIYKKYGLYDETLRSRSDKEMWWRLFGKGCHGRRVKKIFIPVDVAYYRIHPLSMMHQRRINKAYNKSVTKLLEQAYKMRTEDGITKENTRFLEA